VRVLGADACKAGWVGVVLDDVTGTVGVTVMFAKTIDELAKLAEADGPLDAVGVDMPIGFPDTGRRRADRLAREAVGPRRSSVFLTPVRAALEAGDHATAVRVSQELTGDGISIQAYSLRTKLFEVDAWVRATDLHVVEVHPEVSFARMAGAPLPDSKITWAGAERRRTLLAGAGIRLAGELGLAGRLARVDDVLDAAAAAWSACRVSAKAAVSLPDPPDTHSDGLPCAIWV
jgi:predicted RNase H-like nuclease